MKSLSSLCVSLSLVFGCLFLALIAEFYYLLWWKRRKPRRGIENYKNFANYFLRLLCSKKLSSSSSSRTLNPPETFNSFRLADANGVEPINHLHLMKPFGDDCLETDLLSLHNLSGPPRFLSTIKEETKEDLESQDEKSRSLSLSDVILSSETPFMTPLSSPPFFTPTRVFFETYNQHGFNPLFESTTDGDVILKHPSPPPKFKFLRDAEAKYMKSLMENVMIDQKTSGALVIDPYEKKMNLV